MRSNRLFTALLVISIFVVMDQMIKAYVQDNRAEGVIYDFKGLAQIVYIKKYSLISIFINQILYLVITLYAFYTLMKSLAHGLVHCLYRALITAGCFSNFLDWYYLKYQVNYIQILNVSTNISDLLIISGIVGIFSLKFLGKRIAAPL